MILSNFGWLSNNIWQEVTIPLNEFESVGVDLSALLNVFLVSTLGAPGSGTIFEIDNVRYETR